MDRSKATDESDEEYWIAFLPDRIQDGGGCEIGGQQSFEILSWDQTLVAWADLKSMNQPRKENISVKTRH